MGEKTRLKRVAVTLLIAFGLFMNISSDINTDIKSEKLEFGILQDELIGGKH